MLGAMRLKIALTLVNITPNNEIRKRFNVSYGML
jgi:hypothetical protein